MRPIDADALKAHIDKLPALPDGNFAGTHSALKALINMQPTIDAVPVVRCRECKHWAEHTKGYLGICSFISCNFVMENGYCAWGELKEAEAALEKEAKK